MQNGSTDYLKKNYRSNWDLNLKKNYSPFVLEILLIKDVFLQLGENTDFNTYFIYNNFKFVV